MAACANARLMAAIHGITLTAIARLTVFAFSGTVIHSARFSGQKGIRCARSRDATSRTSAKGFARCTTGAWCTMAMSTGGDTGKAATLRGATGRTMGTACAPCIVSASREPAPSMRRRSRWTLSAIASGSSPDTRSPWPTGALTFTGWSCTTPSVPARISVTGAGARCDGKASTREILTRCAWTILTMTGITAPQRISSRPATRAIAVVGAVMFRPRFRCRHRVRPAR